MTDDIAPYEIFPTCRKCEGRMHDRAYVPEDGGVPEHLKMTCQCGYTFRMRCAANTPAAEVTA